MDNTAPNPQAPQPVADMPTPLFTSENKTDWNTPTPTTPDLVTTPSPSSHEEDTPSSSSQDDETSPSPSPTESDPEWDAISETSDTSSHWAVTLSPEESAQTTAYVKTLEDRVDTLEYQCDELRHDRNYTTMKKRYYRFKFNEQVQKVEEMRAQIDKAAADLEASVKERDGMCAAFGEEWDAMVAEKEEKESKLKGEVEGLVKEKKVVLYQLSCLEELLSRMSREEETLKAEKKEMQDMLDSGMGIERQLCREKEALEAEKNRLQTRLSSAEKKTETMGDLMSKVVGNHHEDVRKFIVEKEQLTVSWLRERAVLLKHKDEARKLLEQEVVKVSKLEAEMREMKSEHDESLDAAVAARLDYQSKFDNALEANKELEEKVAQALEQRKFFEDKMKQLEEEVGKLTEGYEMELEQMVKQKEELRRQLTEQLEKRKEQEADYKKKLEAAAEEKEGLQDGLECEQDKVKLLEKALEEAGEENEKEIRGFWEALNSMSDDEDDEIERLEDELRSKTVEHEEAIQKMKSEMGDLQEQHRKSLEDARKETATVREQAEESQKRFVAQFAAQSRAHINMVHAMEQESKRLKLTMGRMTKSLKATALGLDVRVRSLPPSANAVDGRVSIAIHGKYFAFYGPKYAAVCTPLHDSVQTGLPMYPEPLKVTVMCEMGPNFQSFTPVGDNQFRMLINHDYQQRYPAFETKIKSLISARHEISHVSLGSEGAWSLGWVEDGHPRHFYTPLNRLDKEGGNKISRVWWGANRTHVDEYNNGQSPAMWFPAGYYPGLKEYLLNGINGCKTIKALSLDKAGTTAWVLVMANGAVAYSRADRSPGKLGQTFDHFEFEEFATKNFGCDFGALEQTDGHFFPTSCAAFSEEVSKEEA